MRRALPEVVYVQLCGENALLADATPLDATRVVLLNGPHRPGERVGVYHLDRIVSIEAVEHPLVKTVGDQPPKKSPRRRKRGGVNAL